jgi:type II secretory pathway pseudopilin PulG
MKLGASQQTSSGLTLMEFLVVIVLLVGLIAIVFDMQVPVASKQRAQLLNCVNNLKQTGLAYRLWAEDNSGKYPMELSVTNGGTLELMRTADAWRTYQVMSNELSTPRILYCPADTERPIYATTFSADLKGKISYFLGTDGSTNRPQAFLSGDDNLAVSGQSVKPGYISLASNTPIAWTTARHHSRGNIGLSDGSVQCLNNSSLVPLLQQADLATNRFAIP